jgi:hypothetical protein
MELYSGDKIVQKQGVNEITFKLFPYSSVTKIDDSTLIVNFTPPKDQFNVLSKLNDFFFFIHKETRSGATRAEITSDSLLSPMSTLIHQTEIVFSWFDNSKSGKFIVFRDSKGHEQFRKMLDKQSEISLIIPDTIMPGETYTWEIEGVFTSKLNSFTVLAASTSQVVKTDLQSIDKKKSTSIEKQLEKAAYLQFFSDIYNDEVDLYWLSGQILKDTLLEKTVNNENRIMLDGLTEKLGLHIESKRQLF